MPASSHRTMLCVLLLFCGAAARAAEADPGFTVAPIAGSVSVLQGYECNIVASAGDDGIVLVDTCDVRVADKLLAAVKRLSNKPLRFVVNTHVHADHTGGNAVFQKLAPIFADANVRKWLATGNEVTRDKKSPPEALPLITFDGEVTFHLNGEEIRLLELPPGHTDSDVVVFFSRANVVAMGDVFMSPAVSFGDRHYGGGVLGLIGQLELVLPQISNDAKVVPGHGVISTRADVARGLDVLKNMKTFVEGGIRAGKTVEQLVAEKPFDKWKSSAPAWMSSMDGYVKELYRELTARK